MQAELLLLSIYTDSIVFAKFWYWKCGIGLYVSQAVIMLKVTTRTTLVASTTRASGAWAGRQRPNATTE